MSALSRDDLRAIRLLIEQKASRDAGIVQLESYLQQHPGDGAGWFLMGRMFGMRNNHALVEMAMRRAADLEPANIDVLWELYKALNQLRRPMEALALADRIRGIDASDPRGYLGRGVVHERLGEFDACIEWCERALELDSGNQHAMATMGFAYLHKRDYARGWPAYHRGLGHIEHRDKRTFVGEPEWDGTPGRHVVVYSEQGLGDQIAGIEPLRNFPGTVSALAVDPKLRPWFRRCFPTVPYHGVDIEEETRHPTRPLRVDASINLFGLHVYLRKREDDYPKTPYLAPHPRKAAMWRAALDRLGPRPKIGIAWSGGTRLTHEDERTHALAEWVGYLPGEVDLISLEYKNRDEETAAVAERLGREVHVWPDAIRSPDYEDTAALISQLDAVVAPPTTVIHAAGAMGVPAFCLVNAHPNPHYGTHGERMPYYGSVTLIRTDIEALCRHLCAYLSAMTHQRTSRTA